MSDRQHHIERAEATKKLHDEIERLQSRIAELEKGMRKIDGNVSKCAACGSDRTRNTIKAIVDSGVLE